MCFSWRRKKTSSLCKTLHTQSVDTWMFAVCHHTFDSWTFWATIVCTFFCKVFMAVLGPFQSPYICRLVSACVTVLKALSPDEDVSQNLLKDKPGIIIKLLEGTPHCSLNSTFISKNLVATCMQDKQKCVGVHLCQHFMIKPLVHSMHPYFTVHKACCSKVNSIHQQYNLVLDDSKTETSWMKVE